MSEYIFQITEQSFEKEVPGAGLPVLLDLWAPWCAPCRAVAPVLEALAPEYAGVLKIAKLNVEAYPEVQKRLGVRGIPTLILYRGGQELGRLLGVKRADEFRKWLNGFGIEPDSDGVLQREDDGAGAGAFHGDPELRDFLVKRLVRRAEAGEVEASFMPHWENAKGTLSAALVSNGSPEVFSRLTGIPASFAAAIEFCCVARSTPEEVDLLVGGIQAGADLRQVAPRLAVALMNDGYAEWSSIIGDTVVDELRRQWLELCLRKLNGAKVEPSEWKTLEKALEKLKSQPPLPVSERQRMVVAFLAALTPLPRSDEDGRWIGAMVMAGREIRYLLAGSLLGWSAEDFGLERRRFAWYQAREAQQPGGKFTRETLEKAHEEWYAENREAQIRLDDFIKRYAEYIGPTVVKARKIVGDLTRQAGIVAAG